MRHWSVTWQDAAPTLAICGGIFLLGFGYLLNVYRQDDEKMAGELEAAECTEKPGYG